MKTTTMIRKQGATRAHIPYPNSATRKEMIHKVLNMMLSAVSGAAMAAIVLFLLAIA